jgi:hypothetical protein
MKKTYWVIYRPEGGSERHTAREHLRAGGREATGKTVSGRLEEVRQALRDGPNFCSPLLGLGDVAEAHPGALEVWW